ncbi:glycosyltransferase family 4 protein [Microaerobacter geothermalis]|uniref:glycosyltransferase family 4 protein n=1 Tax=Microaerobacter geothermalis TaxID=674972 RepID=UPI001F1E0C35|nr:glycosyltransferase family 4 protein [Microaerobacter geothermalis]MCF6093330.1 glycosyltransferase family 4 protein [Microaerobacter geothermalis]
MKIAIVTPGQFPVPPLKGTSVEISVHQLGNYLADHGQVTVFSRKVNGLPAIQRRGNRKDIRIPVRGSRQYLQQIERHLIKEPSTWIQIENRPMYLLWLKKRWPKAKMILSLHSLTFIENLNQEMALEALSNADVIFVNSFFIKEQLKYQFPEVKTPIYVNYFGIPHHQFVSRFSEEGKAWRNYWRDKLRLHGKHVMLFVGRLIPEKGLHLLLESLPFLITQYPDLHLVVVGSSYYGKQLETNYVNQLHKQTVPLKEHVTFLNYLPPNEVISVYPIADMVVTPSIGKEAYCLVNLEAAISGIPVISTMVGGIPEMVRHSFNGFLINPERWHEEFPQYAARLIEERDLNLRMGKNALTLVENLYEWSKAIHMFIQSYRRIHLRGRR